MSLRLLVSAHDDPQGRVFRYDFDADRAQILLGRRGGVDVLLPDATVSLVHARIERRGDRYELVDDRSTNGTFLNGARLEAGSARPLARGDKVTIGAFVVEVAEAEGDEPFAGDSSISIARRMVEEVLGVLGPGAEHPHLVSDGGQRLAIAEVQRRYLVGRLGSCDLVLDDPSVAEQHLALRRDYQGVTVVDLGSHTGLYVNDGFASGERLLRDGDRLTVGRFTLSFRDPAEVYLRKLEELPVPKAEVAAPPAAAPTRARGRGEVALVVGAAAIGLLAIAGLIYVWLS